MIDHMGITVSDLEKSKDFYDKALSATGYEICMDELSFVSFGVKEGYGKSSDPAGDFWISEGAPVVPRIHIAFSALSRDQVDRFHQAGVSAGGTSNGEPGVRAQYHANYYAAFLLDPDGYNIEVVCHKI